MLPAAECWSESKNRRELVTVDKRGEANSVARMLELAALFMGIECRDAAFGRGTCRLPLTSLCSILLHATSTPRALAAARYLCARADDQFRYQYDIRAYATMKSIEQHLGGGSANLVFRNPKCG